MLNYTHPFIRAVKTNQANMHYKQAIALKIGDIISLKGIFHKIIAIDDSLPTLITFTTEVNGDRQTSDHAWNEQIAFIRSSVADSF